MLGGDVDGSIVVQESSAPLYVVTFNGRVTDDEFRAYLAKLSELLERGGHCAHVYDARLALPAPASQRRMQAEWMKLNDARIGRITAGIAFVVPSALVRGALTAIFWLQPLACPYLITAHFEEGLRWAHQKVGSTSRASSALST